MGTASACPDTPALQSWDSVMRLGFVALASHPSGSGGGMFQLRRVQNSRHCTRIAGFDESLRSAPDMGCDDQQDWRRCRHRDTLSRPLPETARPRLGRSPSVYLERQWPSPHQRIQRPLQVMCLTGTGPNGIRNPRTPRAWKRAGCFVDVGACAYLIASRQVR